MSKPKTDPTRETRYHKGAVQLRASGDGKKSKKTIYGHAAVFDSRSQNLGGFVEMIMPGAFDNVLDDDVRALFNHDENIVLGRSNGSVSTLKLSIDKTGLVYEIDPPETRAADDLIINLERNEVDQSSFSFTVSRDGVEWEDEEDGVIVRKIFKIRRLYDVSPVTFPAYVDTKSAQRSLQAYLDESKAHGMRSLVNKRREMELINLGAD